MAGSKAYGLGRVEVKAVGVARSIRERFPPPWRVEQIPGGFPGGYRVTDAHGRPLAYVYGGARSALPGALTPAEALALARAIARLPEMMPAP
jgi:hypothetical protein